MSFQDPDPTTAAAERRGKDRMDSMESMAWARIAVESTELEGRVQNHSEDGLFIVLDTALELSVVWRDESGQHSSNARIARVTALPGQQSGWGLELIEGEPKSSHA